ncbi:MAG: XrtN system VIT domain protein [Saprospiraceae bacterium]|jgi:XrtN system VIT domain protein
MKTTLSSRLKDKTIATGLFFLALSFILFASTIDVYDTDFDVFSGVFFANFGLTFIYFFMLLWKNKRDTSRYFKFSNFGANIILLQLFNISAYSLNRTITVFNISTNWLIWFLLLSNTLLLVYALWRNYKSNWVNHLIVLISNVAILFHLYESIYIFQIYPIAFVGFWFFGIPLLTFVPILSMIAYIKVVKGFLKNSAQFWPTTLITWVLTIFLVSYVSLRFYKINTSIQQSFHQTRKPYEDKSLPGWLETSQSLQKDWVTERALKSGLVYSTADDMFNTFSRMNINERIKHDPLVVIASFFNDGIDIPYEDRIKILRYMFDARHQTERKLWNGDNLSTSDIVTNVQLFPEYHLAYTEKTLKIINSKISRWRGQQEALYTFYLPEGSVVTSAALWINGIEEPAYLTTKEKADSAFNTIVGVELRDPLLLHWQEGNRVTVRIFPVTSDEARQFKIGVTTPLQEIDKQLVYENIDFEGPFWKGATESINVVTEGVLANISAPFSFSTNGTSHTYLGAYKSDWSFGFDALPLSEQAFTFNEKSYHLQAHQKRAINFDAQEIYLDINAAWTKDELSKIWGMIKSKKAFVYSNNRIEQVTQENKAAIFKQLRSVNFTLFPFYKITNPTQALVISKSNQMTPTLSDLEGSVFIEKMSSFFKKNKNPLRLFNIEKEISPYLSTLKELRAIQLESGTTKELLSLLENKQFYQNQENDQTIVNQYGAFQIIENQDTTSANTSNAPDHLMRLFAYNDILRKVGKNYFNKKELANELVDEAKEAYVVTPISSLIVLETQQDYDRFDIQKSKNSLQNASIGNSGAVPEPKEWLLIMLVLLMTLYFYFRK